MSAEIVVLSLISAVLAIYMLLAKNPITSALCLLGILIMTAGIYGLIGEHFIATIQLIVYAGAITVLFVFSIMLLNLSKVETDYKQRPLFFISISALGLSVFGFIAYGIREYFTKYYAQYPKMSFTNENIELLGGNSKVLAHALFSQFYISFEVISLALLIAIVAAVVLAKRKID